MIDLLVEDNEKISICKIMKEYSYTQIIGIHVAPLREHLSVPKLIQVVIPM